VLRALQTAVEFALDAEDPCKWPQYLVEDLGLGIKLETMV